LSYQSIVLADGAVGYWQLNELVGTTATDSTGNSNGTYTNLGAGGTLGQPGIPAGGTAVLFISSGAGRVVVGDVASQHVGDTFTMEAWVKRVVGKLGSTQAILCGSSSAGLMRFNASDQLDAVKNNIQDIGPATITTVADGIFHHCVWTKAAGLNRLYVDGVNVTGSLVNQTISNSAGYWIGIDPFGTNVADMTACHVALYPTALSAATVQNHFQIGSTTGNQVLLPQGPIVRGRFA
jgi:hypothetical protein